MFARQSLLRLLFLNSLFSIKKKETEIISLLSKKVVKKYFLNDRYVNIIYVRRKLIVFFLSIGLRCRVIRRWEVEREIVFAEVIIRGGGITREHLG